MRSKEREKSNGLREEEASQLNCRQGTARTLCQKQGAKTDTMQKQMYYRESRD
jgi:hypothetical protein